MFQWIGGRRRKRGLRGSSSNEVKREGVKDLYGNESGYVAEPSLCEKNEVSFPGFDFRVDKCEAVKVDARFCVIMSEMVYHKLFMYVTNTKEEISGLGMVEQRDGCFLIRDIFLVKQENTSSNTKIDNEDLAKITQKFIEEYDAGNKDKNPTDMKLWWHSHANSSVFWSGTDDKTCEDYNNDSWLISIVVNHDKKLLCRLELYHPIRISLDNVPVEVICDSEYLESLEDQCRKEIAEKCSKQVWHYKSDNRAGFQSLRDKDDQAKKDREETQVTIYKRWN